jgi:Toastrack DUF4097
MVTTSPPVTPPNTRGRLPLTPGRITALVIGVPICVALVAEGGFSLLAPFAEGSYHVGYTAPANTRSLTMHSAGGQLTVKPTTGDRMTLSGTAHYSFIKSSVTEQTAGGATTVTYHCVTLPSGNCELDATAFVPAGLPVTAGTDGGNASVSDISAPVTLSTGGGDVSADHIAKGPLNLSTDGGNVTASDITAPTFSASSGGGDIQASTVDSGTVTITTDGGNIQVTGVTTDKVSASTGGGDIDIVFAAPPGNVRVTTSGGNITLVLPRDNTTTYNVNTHTDGGNISDGLSVSTSPSANPITATSGGGDIILRYA